MCIFLDFSSGFLEILQFDFFRIDFVGCCYMQFVEENLFTFLIFIIMAEVRCFSVCLDVSQKKILIFCR